MMKRNVFFMIILLAGSVLSAQEPRSPLVEPRSPPLAEPILVSYERNFTRAALSAKAEVLRDAATDEEAADFIGQLYDFALVFSVQNAEILREDTDMIALTVLAARGAGTAGYTASADTLWQVFNVYHDSLIRTAVLESLARLGKGNPKVAGNLNEFLANQNNLYRSRMTIDFSTLEACITALASLGEPSSFPVLFSALILGYPNNIVREAEKALGEIQGDYKQYLIDVIRRNPPVEKLAAFHAGINNPRFGAAEKGEIAEAALDESLTLSASGSEDTAVSDLGYAAVKAVTGIQWNQAGGLAIRHFYRVQTGYQAGAVSQDRLVEAIECLGAMRSPEAAEVLVLQLGYINSQTESKGGYDGDITLAIVKALGEIGDKAAFDNLLYISYLFYSEQIQTAAREALNRLRW
jgi:HEAT repeat protein